MLPAESPRWHWLRLMLRPYLSLSQPGRGPTTPQSLTNVWAGLLGWLVFNRLLLGTFQGPRSLLPHRVPFAPCILVAQPISPVKPSLCIPCPHVVVPLALMVTCC